MLQCQYYEQDWNNHHHSSQSEWEYNSPKSYGQPSYQHTPSYIAYQDQPIKEKFDLTKRIEALIESQNQFLDTMDSQSHKNS